MLLSLTVLTVLLAGSGGSLETWALPKKLSAQAFSAGLILSPSGPIVAVEGIHVKQSPLGPFDLVVIYGGSLEQPTPTRVFVNHYQAAVLLSFVFEGIVVLLPPDSIDVSKVGSRVVVEMSRPGVFLDFEVRALRPIMPSGIAYEFPNAATGWVFKVAGIQFAAVASGQISPSELPGPKPMPLNEAPAFLVPSAGIVLERIA